MNKSIVTESPEELISKAEKDILNVKILFAKNFYPTDLMYDIICFHATQAVEKFLKSFIIKSGKITEKTHNLDYLYNLAYEIDKSFKMISKDCVILNEFTPGVKYSNEKQITKQNVIKVIKSMETICNFPPIKTMRDLFSKDHKYIVIEEITTIPISKKNPNKKPKVSKSNTASKPGKKKKQS